MALKAQRMASIPAPAPTLQSLMLTTEALKSAIEVLIGSIGSKEQRAVTFVDLVNMGVILEDQIPEKFGQPPRPES